MGKRRSSSIDAPPYNREGNRKARRKAEAHRITAMGLLLGATWHGDYFERVHEEVDYASVSKTFSYWDRYGNRISSSDAQKLCEQKTPKFMPVESKRERDAMRRLQKLHSWVTPRGNFLGPS